MFFTQIEFIVPLTLNPHLRIKGDGKEIKAIKTDICKVFLPKT